MLGVSFSGGEIAIYDQIYASYLYISQTDDEGAYFTAFSSAGALSIRKRQNRIFQFNNYSETPQFKQTLPGQFCCAAIGPLEVFLATTDGRVFFYVKTGELLQIAKIHSREVLCLRFKDGALLSGAADGTVAYTLGGERIATFFEHFLPVRFVDFWGYYVVSAGDDKKVRVSELCCIQGKFQLVTRQVLEFEQEIRAATMLGDCIIVAQNAAVYARRLMAGIETYYYEIAHFDDQTDAISCLEACAFAPRVFVGFTSGAVKAIEPSGGITDIYNNIHKPVAQMRILSNKFSENVAEFTKQFSSEVAQDFALPASRVNFALPERVDISQFDRATEESTRVGVSRAEYASLVHELALVSANFE